MNTFTNTLINKEYTFENMNLLDLRNRIINSEQLTRLDILKGYFTKKTLKITPEIINPLTEEQLGNIKVKMNEVIESVSEYVQNEYLLLENEGKARVQSLINKQCEKEGIAPITILDYSKNTRRLTVEVYNAFSSFRRQMERVSFTLSASTIRNYIVEQMNQYIHENINPDISISTDKYSRFPYSEINTQELDTMNIEASDIRFDEIDINKTIDINTEAFMLPEACNSVHIYENFYITKSYDKEQLKNIIEEEVAKELTKEIDVDKLTYNQQIEAMPIMINIVGDVVQLIDGYKRLLYVNDEELLNKPVAVKVFKDLSDEEFLSLLYAANYWKATLKNDDILFHDRGFLFSLKQRFGIKYEDYLLSSTIKTNEFSLIECLSIYDNINYKRLMNEFSPKPGSATYKTPHKYLVSDIKQMSCLKNIMENDIYDVAPLIKKEVINHTISLLGSFRRDKDIPNQKEIDFKELLDSIFNDKGNAHLFKKKRDLSTSVYVCNMLRDTGIDKSIDAEIFAFGADSQIRDLFIPIITEDDLELE